jgi:dienelactone hydrolase
MRLSCIVVFSYIIFITMGCTSATPGQLRTSLLKAAIADWKDVAITPVSVFGDTGGSITGIFLVPKAGKGKHPAVLALHGYTDNKESWIDSNGFSKGGSVTRILLDKGFAVLAIDLPHHGARLPDDRTLDQKKLVLDSWAVFYKDARSDIAHAIDFLAAQSQVDPKRIGLVGYSLGGMIAYSVANTDARIRALVTCVAPPDRGESYPGAPQDNIDRLADTPVLVIAATQDHNYAVEDAEWFFNQLPSRVKEYAVYESTHSLPAEYGGRAAGWFIRFIGSGK